MPYRSTFAEGLEAERDGADVVFPFREPVARVFQGAVFGTEGDDDGRRLAARVGAEVAVDAEVGGGDVDHEDGVPGGEVSELAVEYLDGRAPRCGKRRGDAPV